MENCATTARWNLQVIVSPCHTNLIALLVVVRGDISDGKLCYYCSMEPSGNSEPMSHKSDTNSFTGGCEEGHI
jgi:hypothetical protein